MPTTDPTRAPPSVILPFGRHKGSARSTMIERLGGPMIADRTSAGELAVLGSTSLLPRHDELMLAFDMARFAAQRLDDPLAQAEFLFDAIFGQGARLPSERRPASRVRS